MAQNLEITDINLETRRCGSKSGDSRVYPGELTALGWSLLYYYFQPLPSPDVPIHFVLANVIN